MTYDPWEGHPLNSQTVEEARAAFVERNLRRYRRAVVAGSRDALHDAAVFCRQWAIPTPDWLVDAAMTPAPVRGRGRPPADEADYARWDAVQECRDRRGESHIPATWDETWQAVSDLLLGTPHWGTPETVRASYKRVLRRMRDPARYYIKDLR